MASTAAVSLLSLIEIKLRKDNYLEWKYLISPLLSHLDGLGHINGTSRPNKDDAAQYLDWVRKDTLLIMVINSTLSQSILSVLPTALRETADYTSYKLWELLKELCSADPFTMLLEDPNNENINEEVGVEDPNNENINEAVGVEVEEGMACVRRYHKVASVAVGKVLPSELKEKVKNFIETKGWSVEYIDLKAKKEARYIAPNGRIFHSLVQVCKSFIEQKSSEKPSKKRPRKSDKTVVQLQPAPAALPAAVGEEQGQQPQSQPAPAALPAAVGGEQGQQQSGEEQA